MQTRGAAVYEILAALAPVARIAADPEVAVEHEADAQGATCCATDSTKALVLLH